LAAAELELKGQLAPAQTLDPVTQQQPLLDAAQPA
jgi:hypothetical protein